MSQYIKNNKKLEKIKDNLHIMLGEELDKDCRYYLVRAINEIEETIEFYQYQIKKERKEK